MTNVILQAQAGFRAAEVGEEEAARFVVGAAWDENFQRIAEKVPLVRREIFRRNSLRPHDAVIPLGVRAGRVIERRGAATGRGGAEIEPAVLVQVGLVLD